MKKLSLEYARLQKENEDLRKIIEGKKANLIWKKYLKILIYFWSFVFKAARDALGVLEIANLSEKEDEPGKKKLRIVTEECKGCLSCVGMAVWNCGTFEMDCIKGEKRLNTQLALRSRLGFR